MSLIAIEGCDGVGKTSLAKELSKITGWPVIDVFGKNKLEHRKLNKKLDMSINTIHDDMYFMDIWLRLGRPNCILDRTFVSGMIYGDHDLFPLEYLNRRLREYNEEMLFIFMRAEIETIIERDRDWKGREQRLKELKLEFNSGYHLLSFRNFQTMLLDSDNFSAEELAQHVLEEVEDEFYQPS